MNEFEKEPPERLDDCGWNLFFWLLIPGAILFYMTAMLFGSMRSID